jgi:translation elongation factor EF-1alpha
MQKISSMELEHEAADVAKPGDNVGIEMLEYTREHDSVYVVH